jgi:hypothetical protein
MAATNDWENPRLVGLNNEPPHATMIICPDARTAMSIRLAANEQRVKSKFYRSLNGNWKYHYSRNPIDRVSDFWIPEYGNAEADPEQFRFMYAYSPLRATMAMPVNSPREAWKKRFGCSRGSSEAR